MSIPSAYKVYCSRNPLDQDVGYRCRASHTSSLAFATCCLTQESLPEYVPFQIHGVLVAIPCSPVDPPIDHYWLSIYCTSRMILPMQHQSGCCTSVQDRLGTIETAMAQVALVHRPIGACCKRVSWHALQHEERPQKARHKREERIQDQYLPFHYLLHSTVQEPSQRQFQWQERCAPAGARLVLAMPT